MVAVKRVGLVEEVYKINAARSVRHLMAAQLPRLGYRGL